MNLRAYAYEPAPTAGPHRALGAPSGEGQVFYRASQLPYGPDNPKIDALESLKATLAGGPNEVTRGAGPQPPPPHNLYGAFSGSAAKGGP